MSTRKERAIASGDFHRNFVGTVPEREEAPDGNISTLASYVATPDRPEVHLA